MAFTVADLEKLVLSKLRAGRNPQPSLSAGMRRFISTKRLEKPKLGTLKIPEIPTFEPKPIEQGEAKYPFLRKRGTYKE